MDSTNETHSSENESIRNEMSYLYGRDPSILAYGQRPFPSKEIKKNLMSSLERVEDEQEEKEAEDDVDELIKTSKSSCISSDTSVIPTVNVFLRMRPYPRKMSLSSEQLNAYSILNSTTLLTRMASLDSNSSCLKKIKTNEVISRKFIFTKTFGAETTQLELFESTVQSQIIDFIAGKNSVVMSYGTTNSGKTYTLQGTPESPGIIPRGIELVFCNVNPKTTPYYKPLNYSEVVSLNNFDRRQEMEFKIKLLSLNPVEKNYHVNNFKQMQKLLHAESPIKPSYYQNSHYSVWVSFAEIYNETIYDLLTNDCQKKRPSLKLAVDNRGRAYIKGLKNVCVSSGGEAYQVFMVGQYNLKVAATALNSKSSRSHCIFTITLLKYEAEHNPQSVSISTFSFCDLAGSERLKKTLNVGERLKEAQNINTSLLVLGRCLKTIYDAQNCVKQKNESIGPFRESKLTRLFQRALSGKEQLSMIVNVNPVPNLYVETQNVLNFSAIAKKIIVEPHNFVKPRKSLSRFSRLITQSIKTEVDWEDLDEMAETSEDCTDTDETETDSSEQESYEELLAENEMLKKEIQDLKNSVLTRDIKTRQEMTDTYTKIMNNLELNWKSRMLDLEEQQEDLRESAIESIESYYKEKLSQLSSRKRSRLLDEDEEEGQNLMAELELENTRLKSRIDTYKKSIKDLKQQKEVIESEKTKISFDLAVAKEENKRIQENLSAAQKSIGLNGDSASNTYIDGLNKLIEEKNERIKKMKEFLNEAKDEYILITSQAQKMEGQIEEHNKVLAEKMEYIQDLEDQLHQANECSAQQTKTIESLEEELESLSKKLIAKDDRINELTLLVDSNTQKNSEAEGQEHIQEEFVNTKMQLEEIKTNFEISKKENLNLQELLDHKNNEIDELKSSLDSTKNQLNEFNKKFDSLTLKDSETSPIKIHDFSENSVSSKALFADISCQTIETENLCTEFVENISLTSSCQNQSSSFKKEPSYEKTEAEDANSEKIDELQKKIEKLEELLMQCEAEKSRFQEQFEKITENLQTQIKNLNKQICEKNGQLDMLSQESEIIQKNFQEQIEEFKVSIEIQKREHENLSAAYSRVLSQEQDKDKEISSLQKEIKSLIQSNDDTLKKMEMQMKMALKDLASEKEKVIKAEEKYKKLDKECKQVVQIFETKINKFEKKLLEQQTENIGLKQKLNDTEGQLDEMIKKRNDIVLKNKNSAKSHTPARTYVKHDTDDEKIEKIECKKEVITPEKENIPKSEISEDSEESTRSKSCTKKKAPASTRKPRARKLYVQHEDSYIDLEKESTPQSTPKPRSLRNRKK